MIPELNVEVYRLIAENVKRPVVPHLIGRTAEGVFPMVQDQSDLLALYKISWLLKDICEPLLHEDVVVDRMSSFLTTCGESSRVERIRLHQWCCTEANNYREIFANLKEDRWSETGHTRRPGSPNYCSRPIDVVRIAHAAQEVCLAGESLLRKQMMDGERDKLFPRLRRVVLGDVGDLTWTLKHPTLELYYSELGKQLPMALLGIPTVQHVCQSLSGGPLTLPADRHVKPNTPISSFTYHLRMPGARGWSRSTPPLVIGCVNRYIFKTVHTVKEKHLNNPSTRRMIEGCVEDLLSIFAQCWSKHLVFCMNGDEPVLRRLDPVDIASTTIEIYDFIRSRKSDSKAPGGITPVQLALERQLGSWSGRVAMKNREDCPACPACGYDRKAEYDDEEQE